MDENPAKALEKEFQDVLHELLEEKNMQRFRVEYERLLAALIKAHECEKRLMAECRELKAELNVKFMSSQSLKQVEYEKKR